MLKRYEAEFNDDNGWQDIREGLSVKLVKGGGSEKYVLCKSADRAGKEQSMLQRQLEKFMAGIEKKNRLRATARLPTMFAFRSVSIVPMWNWQFLLRGSATLQSASWNDSTKAVTVNDCAVAFERPGS
jgi:hypothetical protein